MCVGGLSMHIPEVLVLNSIQISYRLYNQLAEVQQQREEKAKQEAYAQNRARAKEFHKVIESPPPNFFISRIYYNC